MPSCNRQYMKKVTKIIGLNSRRIFLAEQLLEHPGFKDGAY